MSAVKLDYPSSYKLFEPGYPPPRPIIVGEGVESPDTVTLKYEEEVARANGGDLRGESPAGLLPMSYAKPQPTPQLHGYPESAYPQYATQSFQQPTTENATQMNQMAVQAAVQANSTTTQYIYSPPTIISCQPNSGSFGTRVIIKVSTQHDVTPPAYFSVSFGAYRCTPSVQKDAQDANGCIYSVFVDAPQFMETQSQDANVQLTLAVESSSNSERVAVGTFYYHDTQSNGTEAPPEAITSKASKSPEHRASPPLKGQDIPPDTTTYSSGYPPPTQAPQSAPTYTPTGYNTGNTNANMIGTYSRAQSFSDPLMRPALRSPGWSAYSNTGLDTSSTRSPGMGHPTIPRPSPLTPLPVPPSNNGSGSAPLLIRTSTIQGSGSPGAGAYNPYGLYPNKAHLKIEGDLDNMAENWSQEEVDNRRRIVLFKKTQTGSTLTTRFRAVSVNERPPNSICISCIWWQEKGECFVTSVDTIHLLEQLLAAPARFTVEEKNRIRRNLEGFHPLTVSKAKAESEEFFKIIMAFPNPKPRNIEKDVKVFPWKVLGQALKKIISKYSASPSSTVPPATGHMGLNPYPSMPPTPTDAIPPPPPYGPQHDLQSPRTAVSGPPQSWTPYAPTAANRTLSPVGAPMRESPQTNLRMPLPHAYDTRPPPTTAASYSMPTAAPRWDPAVHSYGPADTAAPAYPTHGVPSSHHHQYGTAAAYGDGAQRA